MGSMPLPALQVQQQPSVLDQWAQAMRIKQGFLGQELAQEQIKEAKLRGQQLQIEVQGQQSIVGAQRDKDWDATDTGKVEKIFDKYSVPDAARMAWYKSRAEYNTMLSGQSKDAMALTQSVHNRFDDLFQSVNDQASYDKAKQTAAQFVQQTVPQQAQKHFLSEISEAPPFYSPDWITHEHAVLRTAQDLNEQALKKAQAFEAQQKGVQAGAETGKVTAETANLPTPADAAAQRAATLANTQATTRKSNVETAKAQEEVNQLKQQREQIGQADATGFASKLSPAEYNKRYDAFGKSPEFQSLQKLQGSYQQFSGILDDLDSGKPMSGATSVVALFNAVGISATPLAGKGFRINNNVIQEHVGARGLDQAAYQKILGLKEGDVITPQQVRDYAQIAADVYKNAYVNTADEAHRQGLPADFLPQGGGRKIDGTTAKIYAAAIAHQIPQLTDEGVRKAAMAAAKRNGWDVGQLSTTASGIWGNAVADARNKQQPAASQGPAAKTTDVWGAAVADARGQRAPMPSGSYQTRSGGPVIQPGQGQQTTEAGNKVITPIPGESFSDTMNRGIAAGRIATPQDIQRATQTAGREAPLALAAGPAMAAAQLAVPVAAGAALAPATGTATIGTGILDAAGGEITREAATQGASIARAGVNLAVNAIKAHPIIATYVGTHLASALGIPLPKVLKAMAGIREVAE